MVPIDKGPGDDLCDYAGFQRLSFAYMLTPSLEYNRIQRTLIFCLSSREVRRCSSCLILWLSQNITIIGSGWSELISFPHVFTQYPSFGWQDPGHQALEVSRISAAHSQAKVMLPVTQTSHVMHGIHVEKPRVCLLMYMKTEQHGRKILAGVWDIWVRSRLCHEYVL